jgi:hypothetical protein
MKQTKNLKATPAAFWALVSSAALLIAADPGHAATTYKANLVPLEAGTAPGFSANGSSVKIVGKNKLSLKGKIKNVVDVDGNRVTTQRNDPDDDYILEIDIFVPATDPATDAFSTISIPFDLKNGNGKFKTRMLADDLLKGAVRGYGILIEAIRIFDGSDTLIGGGGVALRRSR